MHRALQSIATALAATLLMACSVDDGEPSAPIPTPPPVGPASKHALGEACKIASDCESAQCFAGGMASYCTLQCGADTAKTVCVAPTFNGVCNKQGFCRKP